MAYRVEYDPDTGAALTTRDLAAVDYLSLVEALGAAARAPFDPAHSKPTSDIHVRRVEFGVTVVGVAVVFVDPGAEVVKVHQLRWIG